jgi:hypothetical protein
LAVCTASDFTSVATIAKPLPDSPAHAALIVALSASRLVWPAILRIRLTTSPAPLLLQERTLHFDLVPSVTSS